MSSVHQDVLTQPHVPGLPSVRGFGARLGAAAYLVLETLADWQQRASERAHLAALHDDALSDMGISRADAAREASKPFWRA